MQRALAVGLLLVALVTFPPAPSLAGTTGPNLYRQTNLVSDLPGLAAHTDPDLVNPWGIASTPISPFWISDNGTGLSTLYNTTGVKQGLVVTVSPPTGSPAGTKAAPTGVVFNNTTDFAVPGGTARFIFATEDGTINGWPGSGTVAVVAVPNPNPDTSPVYMGLALGSAGGHNYLYAANFRGGTIDIFDAVFAPATATFAGKFQDSGIPSGFAPFNIQNLGGQLYVTYAKQGAEKKDDVPGRGNGFVDVFRTDGTLVRRFASGDPLNSPWGLAIAPSEFGRFSGDVLVGNFGDGRINAFSSTGVLQGTLKDIAVRDLIIEGLWGLRVGNGGNGGDVNTLYFTAGINHEDHGLFGALSLAPDLTVETSVAESSPYTAGQTIHYRVKVTNAGGAMSPDESISIMDRLGPGVAFKAVTGGGVTCTFASPDVACSHAALAGAGTFTFDIEVQLPTRLPGNKMILSQVEVDPTNAIVESDEANNKAQVTIPVQ